MHTEGQRFPKIFVTSESSLTNLDRAAIRRASRDPLA
jgi:hypothetical protein